MSISKLYKYRLSEAQSLEVCATRTIDTSARQHKKAWVSYYRALRDDSVMIQCATRLELRVRYKRSPNRGIYKCQIVRTI